MGANDYYHHQNDRDLPLDRARVNSAEKQQIIDHFFFDHELRYGVDWVDDFFLLSQDSRHASHSIRLPSTSICLVFWFILRLRVVGVYGYRRFVSVSSA